MALKFLIDLIKIIPVIGVDQSIIIKALESDLKDFEDAVQVFSASAHSIEYIITRNIKDFHGIQLKVLTAEEAYNSFFRIYNQRSDSHYRL